METENYALGIFLCLISVIYALFVLGEGNRHAGRNESGNLRPTLELRQQPLQVEYPYTSNDLPKEIDQ